MGDLSVKVSNFKDIFGLHDGLFSVTKDGIDVVSEFFKKPPIYNSPDWVNHYQNFWLLEKNFKIYQDSETFFSCKMSTIQKFNDLENPIPREFFGSVSNMNEDIRLSAGSFQIFDFRSGLFVGFSQSNYATYAVYGILDSVPELPWVEQDPESFSYWNLRCSEEERDNFYKFKKHNLQRFPEQNDDKIWKFWKVNENKTDTSSSSGSSRKSQYFYYHRFGEWIGKQASFIDVVEICRREGSEPLNQIDTVKISLKTTKTSQIITFMLDDEEVFKILKPGRRLAEKYRVLEKGGYPTDIHIDSVVLGFGITSMLDAACPYDSRKQIRQDSKMKIAISQLSDHNKYYGIHPNVYGELENVDPNTFFATNIYNYHKNKDLSSCLFGQGAIFRISNISNGRKNIPKDQTNTETIEVSQESKTPTKRIETRPIVKITPVSQGPEKVTILKRQKKKPIPFKLSEDVSRKEIVFVDDISES